jgi:carbonic anhydrase
MMKINRSFILIAAMFASTAWGGEQQEWGYEGPTGPSHWGKLSPAYAMCDAGRNQSPINIEDALRTSTKPLHPSYAAGSKDILNNGHTVQIDFESGDTLVVDNLTFTLNQVHFHAPSENQIAGKSFPMEAHLVHADSQGNLLVVALMFREGEANRALSATWDALPPDAGPARPLLNVMPLALLPKSISYYRFSGSLTTPPCTEGVRWVVLKTPVSASRSQIETFQRVVKHHNNRPVQPLNGRVVIEVK